jgi:transcription antitermination factor NusA-like protein
MKILPADKTCINSGFLCTNCQARLDAGEISEFEIDLAKDLIQLEEQEEQFAFLREISFYKAIDYEDVVILVVGRKDKLKITPDLISWVKETYEIDELIIIEKTNKPRPVVEALIAPSKLVSLNEIFLATGDIQFRAVLWEDDRDKLLFTKEELEELIYELTGNITRVEFQ